MVSVVEATKDPGGTAGRATRRDGGRRETPPFMLFREEDVLAGPVPGSPSAFEIVQNHSLPSKPRGAFDRIRSVDRPLAQ